MSVITSVRGDVWFRNSSSLPFPPPPVTPAAGVGGAVLGTLGGAVTTQAAALNGGTTGAGGVVIGSGGGLGAGTGYRKLNEVTKWTFSAKVNTHDYASNYTAGVRRKLRGTKTATGNVKGVIDPVNPIWLQVNEDMDGYVALFFTTGYFIWVPVIIDKFDPGSDVDIDNGGIEGWDFDWAANGLWTYPSAILPLVATAAEGYGITAEQLAKAADNMQVQPDDPFYEEDLQNMQKVACAVAQMNRKWPGTSAPATNRIDDELFAARREEEQRLVEATA